MGQDKILGLFFEEPSRVFQIREIARLVKIPKSTVARNLDKLLAARLIIKKRRNFTGYSANENDSIFRLKKKNAFFEKMVKSGLVDHLNENFHPKCVILFGSFSKGESNKQSDIDIFLQSAEKKFNLSNFEKKLKHPINLFFEEDFSKLSNELFNNVVNGIKLSGYIRLK